jgi:hypothetical protein
MSKTTVVNLLVKDLPTGFFKERLTELVKDPTIADVWLVAEEGFINDWAAYIGWPDLDQIVLEECPNAPYYCSAVRTPVQVL